MTGKLEALALAVALAACALSSGCLDALEPEVGPPVRDICRNQDSDPDTDVSFSADILAGIFARPGSCHDCHLPGAATPIGVEIGGLDLGSRATLLAGGTVSGADIVIPGQPCESILWQKVTAGPPFGARMPASGPPFLTPEQVQLISDWIAEGARDN